VSPAEQETRSRLDQMRAAGYADPDLEQAGKLLDLTWSFLRTGKGWDEYAAARQAGVEKGYPEYLFESDTPDSAAWAWGRMNMFYDPLPALARVQCPVVAIYGERDIYVSTAVNMPLLVRTLTEAGNSAVTAVVLPGAGHNLGRASNLPIHLSNGVGDEGFMTLWRWSRARFPELP
jgi:pimeloyl-ACP methyl ester carboxylesterase